MFVKVDENILQRFLRICFVVLICFRIHSNAEKNIDSDEFVDIGIRLIGEGGDELLADLIAEERDLLNHGHIRGLDMFHFRVHQKRGRRTKRSVEDLLEELKRDDRIEFVTIGETLRREKRDFSQFDKDEVYIPQSRHSSQGSNHRSISPDTISKESNINYNDPLYRKQWYLENNGQLNTPPNFDLNVVAAWQAGYTGVGVSICIVDDGVQHAHPDLIEHYLANISYDLNDLDDPDHDPTPNDKDPENSHGTRCAGAAVGAANNNVCGVGVAPNASIAGIRLLDGRITTILEARAITMFDVDTHIKSCSWGPPDDGKTMDAPGPMIAAAMEYAVTNGRNGKGTVFVWASGNGGSHVDHCGADGYVSHRSVISIGSLNHLGQTTYFDERCPSTMATVPAGGPHTSSDRNRLDIGVVAADLGDKCTTSFFGTSAAAPVAAGALALVLEANPDLTHRDVMYIIAETARIPTLDETEGWLINGGGYHVNDRFGFGVLDVGLMVAKAQQWTNVQPLQDYCQEYQGKPAPLRAGRITQLKIHIEESGNITFLEHVVANISFRYHRRGDLKITLISPSQTPSVLLSYRKNDAATTAMNYFPFTSVHHWGENPIGQWTLIVECLAEEYSEYRGDDKDESPTEISYFGLHFYGTYRVEDKLVSGVFKRSSTSRRAFIPEENEIEYIYNREFESRNSPNIMAKRDFQRILDQRRLDKLREEKTDENLTFFARFKRIFGF